MSVKKVGQLNHRDRKNPAAREKWLAEKRVGRPRQVYDLATKTYHYIFPSGVHGVNLVIHDK